MHTLTHVKSLQVKVLVEKLEEADPDGEAEKPPGDGADSGSGHAAGNAGDGFNTGGTAHAAGDHGAASRGPGKG